MSADFQILDNGAPVVSPIVMQSNAFTAKELVIVHNNGVAAEGKLVQMETSCLMALNPVVGNLDENGQLAFVIGPGFGMKGNATVTITAGSQKKRTLEVKFV